jgi:hypothetical protein
MMTDPPKHFSITTDAKCETPLLAGLGLRWVVYEKSTRRKAWSESVVRRRDAMSEVKMVLTTDLGMGLTR